MRSWVEHEKSFITFGLDQLKLFLTEKMKWIYLAASTRQKQLSIMCLMKAYKIKNTLDSDISEGSSLFPIYPFHSDGLSDKYIYTISMEKSILYFKGLPVKISIKWCISVPEDYFYLSKQCRPWWNATLSGISSGFSLFAKAPVYPYPEWKGLFVWFDFYVPVNNLSVMLGQVFLGWTSTKQG